MVTSLSVLRSILTLLPFVLQLHHINVDRRLVGRCGFALDLRSFHRDLRRSSAIYGWCVRLLGQRHAHYCGVSAIHRHRVKRSDADRRTYDRNCMWGSFWIAFGILYAFTAAGAVPPHSIYTHFPELAAWFVVLTVFTWSAAIAATARDVVLCGCLFSLAIGSTIACSLFAFNPAGTRDGIKAAAYFWMFSSLCAWWRVTVYMIEEAYGPDHPIRKFFPIVRLPQERRAPTVIPGLGEPGVKRGVPKPLPV